MKTVRLPGKFTVRVPEGWSETPPRDRFGVLRLESGREAGSEREAFRFAILPPFPEPSPLRLLEKIASTSGAEGVLDGREGLDEKTRTMTAMGIVRFADHHERVKILYLLGGIVWISQTGLPERIVALASTFEAIIDSFEPSPLLHK